MSNNPRLNGSPHNPSAHKWITFAVVALATTMQAMDFSFVNLSYPILTKIFKSQLATVVWLNLMFSLIVIGFGPFFGKLIDIIGRRKIFLIGSALMILGLITCSVSRSIEQLIIFRILYALGSAIITTCFAAIITDIFTEDERGKGMGLWNAALSIGFTAAPFLAGILLNWLDWRSIFYIRVPIAVTIFLMAFFLLKKDKPVTQNLRFDFIGTLTSSVGFLSLIIGINLISRFGIGSPLVYALIIIGFILIALFIYIETKAENPIVDLSLFKNISFSTGILTIFLFWCAVQGSVVTTPFFLMETLGLPVSLIGILFTISPIIMTVSSPISGYLSDRIGPITLLIAGIALSAISLFVMWTFDRQTHIFSIIIVQIIGGVATGITQPANNSLIMGSVKPEKRGMASALSASLLHFGLALGMGWAGMFYSIRTVSYKEKFIGQGLDSAISANQSVHLAFHDVIIIATFIQLLTLIFSIIPKVKIWHKERVNINAGNFNQSNL